MKGKDPAFPFYAADYLVDTLRWTREMKSLHVDLMAESWVNGWPDDDAGFPHGMNEADKKIWPRIQHKWKLEGGKWLNSKLLFVRNKRLAYKEKQSEIGRKGGRPLKTQPLFSNNPNDKPEKSLLENELEYEIENENLKLKFKDWMLYRSEEKNKPLTIRSLRSQIKFLKQHDAETACMILKQSMDEQWEGLFELKPMYAAMLTSKPSGTSQNKSPGKLNQAYDERERSWSGGNDGK